MKLSVDEATESDPELADQLNRLLPQLSSSASPLTAESLSAIVKSDSAHLLVARDGNDVVGMATLVVFPIPTGIRAWIEDVVVDEGRRGARIGESLVNEAIALARSLGARTVDLTSRPSRQAAHRLYLRAGFATRETSVYRWQG